MLGSKPALTLYRSAGPEDPQATIISDYKQSYFRLANGRLSRTASQIERDIMANAINSGEVGGMMPSRD